MRGIGFTVQTADPQSASCAAFLHLAVLNTQLLVCVHARVQCFCMGFMYGGWRGDSDCFYKAKLDAGGKNINKCMIVKQFHSFI